MKRKITQDVAIHIAIIILFICYEIFTIILMGTGIKWYRLLLYYIPNLIFFYTNTFAVMRLWRGSTKMLVLPFIFIELLAHFGVYLWIDNINNQRLMLDVTDKDCIQASYRSLYVLGISLAYWSVLKNRKQAQEIYELKLRALDHQNKQTTLENAYLRAKADPHLTFNVLNVLYSKIESQMPSEATAVKLLSDTMDFAMGNTGPDGKIYLEEEIDQVQKKIALYQFLNRNAYQIQYTSNVAGNNGSNSLRIPPLVLVTLVDNIFMHGHLVDKNNPATILIACKGNTLFFNQSNVIAGTQRQSHGLGLEFVRRCLSFYYPGAFEINAKIENNQYTINLSIAL